MNKHEIIEMVYKRGKKYEGCLMGCYSTEIFTRKEIKSLVRKYHSSKRAIDAVLDKLVQNEYVRSLTRGVTNNGQYTVSKKGEEYLSSKFPGLRYAMSSIVDRHVSPNAKIPKMQRFIDLLGSADSESEKKIINNCFDNCVMLLSKNKRYGNSSLEPFGLFPEIKRESKIEARMEDKLKRIYNIQRNIDENLSLITVLVTDSKKRKDYIDAVKDLTGYLHLYQIALEQEIEKAFEKEEEFHRKHPYNPVAPQ